MTGVLATTTLPQERRLATVLPGPRSQELMTRRAAAVTSAVSSTVPLFVERAGGGVLVDVDGNSLIDLGSGIAVVSVGNAAPRVVEAVSRRELDLAAAARGIHATMLPRLRALQERHPAIGDVRGRGAMLAMELVLPGTLEPDPVLTGRIARACHAQGVVVLTAGTWGNVLRFLPPLVIGQDLLTEALDVLEAMVDAEARAA